MLWPYIYDIVFVLIFALLMLRGWRTGFLSSLLRLIGWVLALFLILRYSLPLATWSFDNILQERIILTVAAAIPQELIDAMHSGAMATQDALIALQQVLNTLSGFLGHQTVSTGNIQTILDFMQNDGMTLAQSITETILQPVIVPLLQALFSLILFILCVSLFKALARWSARHHTGYSLFGKANSALGCAVGFLEAAAVAYVYAFILSSAAHGLGGRLEFLNPEVYDKTILVSLLLK